MDVVWIFLPLLGSFLAHAPVLKLDLFRSLKRPIDGGATFRGKRVLGDNKTWRGALTMMTGVVLMTLVLSTIPGYWSRLPEDIQRAGALRFGALLGLGTVLGELPNSFLKRRLDIRPGAQRPSPLGLVLTIFDQGDFVPGIWLTLAPVWVMSFRQAAMALVCVVLVHLVINVIGYALGARKTLL